MSAGTKLLAALALVVLLAAGAWFLAAVVATSYVGAIALASGWVVACAAAAELAGHRRPRLRRTLRATLAGCVVLGLAGGYVTTVRETVVDEPLVTGVPASRLPAPAVDPLAPQE